MKKSAPWLLFLMLFTITAFAEDKDVLPNNYLTGMHVIASHPAPGGPNATLKRLTSAFSFSPSTTSTCSTFPPPLACADTLIRFNGQFNALGVYLDGTARNTWQYSMVGKPPS